MVRLNPGRILTKTIQTTILTSSLSTAETIPIKMVSWSPLDTAICSSSSSKTTENMHGTELTWKEHLAITIIVFALWGVFIAIHWKAIFG